MRPAVLAELAGRVQRLLDARPGARVIVGITGAPGSGKTTLAAALVGELGRRAGSGATHVPMDGFHLADVELRRLGLTDRKGAPETFDPGGYCALLRRLRNCRADVWAPAFDREIEQPIAGSIPIPGTTRVIVTEGNYLLLDRGPWAAIRELLDEVWFCELEEAVRLERLVARHERFGKSPAAARAWATGPDQRNAELIMSTRDRADLVLPME
jgi:pantothenate kinase